MFCLWINVCVHDFNRICISFIGRYEYLSSDAQPIGLSYPMCNQVRRHCRKSICGLHKTLKVCMLLWLDKMCTILLRYYANSNFSCRRSCTNWCTRPACIMNNHVMTEIDTSRYFTTISWAVPKTRTWTSGRHTTDTRTTRSRCYSTASM